MIVLDTSVLSLAFRRRARPATEPAAVAALRRMIVENRELAVPGIVFQEILSGLRSPADLRRMLELLDGFPLHFATRADHLRGGEITNACRRAGVRVATVDALVAAIAINADAMLPTVDGDHERIAEHTQLQLYPV